MVGELEYFIREMDRAESDVAQWCTEITEALEWNERLGQWIDKQRNELPRTLCNIPNQ